MSVVRPLFFVLLLASLGSPHAHAAEPVAGSSAESATHAPQDWNPTEITWVGYEQGRALAKESHRPIMLVFYAEWCPHCANYGKLFSDPRVVALARRFVMIRVDVDADPTLSKKWSIDGGYVPRTFFLSSDGTPATTIHAPRADYRYFYDEMDATAVLAGMTQAAALR